MTPINVAIAGIGNCASSLVQGIAHYSNGGANEAIGLSHWDVAGWRPKDLKIVAGFDVDRRKVGLDVAEAIFAEPNCTTVFCDHVAPTGATVMMGPVLMALRRTCCRRPRRAASVWPTRPSRRWTRWWRP